MGDHANLTSEQLAHLRQEHGKTYGVLLVHVLAGFVHEDRSLNLRVVMDLDDAKLQGDRNDIHDAATAGLQRISSNPLAILGGFYIELRLGPAAGLLQFNHKAKVRPEYIL